MRQVFLVAVLVSVVPLLIFATTRGELATVALNDKSLVVEPTGMMRVWALQGRVIVPREDIVRAEVTTDFRKVAKRWRRRGTSLPFVLWAGKFSRGSERSLLLARPKEPALVLELNSGPFDWVVVACSNAKEVAAALSRP